jgi:hypothetical protein
MKLKERLINKSVMKAQLLPRVFVLALPVAVYAISHGEDGKRSIKYESKIVLPKRLVKSAKAEWLNGRELHSARQEVLGQFNKRMTERAQTNERYAKFVPLELFQFSQLKIAEPTRGSFRNRIQYFVLSCVAPGEVLSVD